MTKIVSRTVADVKDSTIAAAKIEAGHIANKQLVALIKKQVKPTGPMGFMAQSALGSELGEAVVGVVAAQALKELRGEDPRVVQLADAMTFAAMQDLIRSFDINGMIDDLLAGAPAAPAAE